MEESKTLVRLQVASAGFEKSRDSLIFRCPAAAYGFNCSDREECESLASGGIGEFGRVVIVPPETNRRIDQVLGFERHTIRGKQIGAPDKNRTHRKAPVAPNSTGLDLKL